MAARPLTVIHEIEQTIWLDTPRGLALAKFLVDRGIDADIEWVTVLNGTGQILSFDNSEVLVCKSFTLGRRTDWNKFKYKPPKMPSRPPNSMARMLRKG